MGFAWVSQHLPTNSTRLAVHLPQPFPVWASTNKIAERISQHDRKSVDHMMLAKIKIIKKKRSWFHFTDEFRTK